MIRAVVDTNTLASGAVTRQGAIAALMDARRRRELEIVLSDHILTELERTLRKPYFAARLSEQDRRDFLALLREYSTSVGKVDPIQGILEDDPDSVVLATALSAGVAFLISGDRASRTLSDFRGVRIVSAREFRQETGL